MIKKNQSLCLLWTPCQVIAPCAPVETLGIGTSVIPCTTLKIIHLISKSPCFRAETTVRSQQLWRKEWEKGPNRTVFCLQKQRDVLAVSWPLWKQNCLRVSFYLCLVQGNHEGQERLKWEKGKTPVLLLWAYVVCHPWPIVLQDVCSALSKQKTCPL